MKRVVITGIGAVTPLGNDAPTTWEGLATGRSGVGELTTIDTDGFPVRIAGQVKDFRLKDLVPREVGLRHLSRPGQFGLAAAREALRDAGVDRDTYESGEMGVCVGASVGRPGLQWLLDVGELRETTGEETAFLPYTPSESLEFSQNVPAAAIARLFDATGPLMGVSTACSGSGHAIGEAFRAIQEGDATLMVAGGFDSLTSWMDVLGFTLLGALTDRYNDDPQSASRPFDGERSGFVLGEGGVLFVLEELESALARGARIHAEVLGYGSSLNAWRITDSPPDGSGAIESMASAIADSGVGTGGIDYVVAHGTSTHGNDQSETVAIKKVFGDDAHRLVISSPKSMAGHLTSAGAALNVLAAIGAINNSLVPPTINLTSPDRKLDLDYVPNTAREQSVSHALINAFAFGGTNISLVVGGYER
ncbi:MULTISPECIES: beta-ketoacyl-[acyl-carrier-protein] synthase family protein [unclassified Streptomyces]|uniref:beta-ketoacyl-[acyl-carrier-protein] synthase family protein n=1 Tax=unclassified Streptomyces TaxID=2593676 RepID=UPI000F6ED501|nr:MULTISPECIES: beta-ketoacyl-[acyl-carrier-protein] synthase family protein [unclassified Streptomyces]AZM90817.1 beta-ketoacyl-[acyl-carrier-protein] synthase family protein [Streptomyces sp. W1SF4]RSS63462.1 beta-ketoacyl-[acyl-carrier-protein] synthase family protein [Streptomyces sp. WAC07061]